MRIIRRYIAKEFLKVFLLCLSAVTSLYLIVDIFERLNSLLHYNAPFSLALLYFLNKIPLVVSQVIPVVFLISTVITLGIMGRYNETTALRASGVSLFQMVTPILALALAGSILLLIGDEYLVSQASYRAEEIYRVEIKKKQRRSFFKKNQLWYHKGRNIYYVRKFDPELDLLQEVTILTFNDQFELESRLDAVWAQWHGGQWHFYQVNKKRFGDGKIIQEETYPEQVVDIPETPQTFEREEKKAEEMSLSELRRLVKKLREEGYDPTRYRVDMQAKISFPFGALVMAFIGIPFALRSGRTRGLALGLGASLFIAFIYWATHSLSLSLGHAGALPPWAAAWLANLLFIAFGIWLFLHIRQ